MTSTNASSPFVAGPVFTSPIDIPRRGAIMITNPVVRPSAQAPLHEEWGQFHFEPRPYNSRNIFESNPAGRVTYFAESPDSASRKKLHDRCLAYHRASAIDFAPQANLILPGLFLCDMYSATDELVLNSIRPTHIMHVLARPTCSYGAPIHTKRIAIEDKSTVDILSHLDDAMEWLHEAIEGGGTVLVHCMWGKSRSAAFVMAYLMAKKGMSLEAAFGHVKERRSIIGPNEGFMRQLRVFEKKLRRSVSQD